MKNVESELDLRIKRPLRKLTEADWPDWTSEAKVIADMVKHSGLLNKSVAIETGIDPTVLSKAQGGSARLSEAEMDALMDVAGSEAWLHFWLLKRGYDPRILHRMETDLEKKCRELQEKLNKVEAEREVELRLLSKIRVSA